jgi:hypothetical protein
MTRHIILMALATAIFAAAGAPATTAAENATVKASAAWVGQGRIFQTGENNALFLGAFGGVLYVESEEGKLDAVELICPGTVDIELKSGAQEGSGKCIVTDEDGDRVFADWVCSGPELLGCKGTFTLTSGTGKFQGITGKSPLKARTAFSAIVIDLKSGAVAKSGAGLLVLPELTYKLP